MFRDETGVFTTLHDTTPLIVQRNWRFYRMAQHTSKCSEKLAFLPHCRHDTTPLNVQRNWCFYHTARHNTSKCSEKLAFQPHSTTQHRQMFRETGVSTTPAARHNSTKCSEKVAFLPHGATQHLQMFTKTVSSPQYFGTPHSLIPPHERCHPVGGKSVTVNYIVTMTEQSLPAVPQDLWNTNLCRAARA